MSREEFKDKKILLIHAPFGELVFGKEWKRVDSLAPPLGLMFLAHPIIEAGFNLNFIDLNVDRLTKRQFKREITSSDYIGISCYSDSLVNVKKLINLIRGIKKDAFILCGGPYCNLSRNYIDGADLVAIGETERYIVEILKRLIEKKSLKDIPGLIYLKNGKLIKNPGIMTTNDLNLSRHASLRFSRIKDYGHFFGLKINNIIGIMTSRGCPFSCRYCTHKGLTNYRERDSENVMEEIRELIKDGYKYFIFYDDNFLINKVRVRKIMNQIIKERLKIRMIVQGRVDSCDYEFYKLLKKAGVAMIFFGIESANQDVLDYYDKKTNVSIILKAISMANKAGIITLGYFIIGAPMETNKYFKNNLALANYSHLDLININILGYYQGADLWDEAVSKGLIKKNETIVWANEKLSNFTYKELCEIKKKMLRNFYLNPLRIMRLFFKVVRLGEINLLLKVLVHSNIRFLDFIYNPFSPKKKKGKVTS